MSVLTVDAEERIRANTDSPQAMGMVRDLIDTLDVERQANVQLLDLIGKLLTRSPLTSNGVCAYCGGVAGQLVVRGQAQWVHRHAQYCAWAMADSLVKEFEATNAR